MDRRLLLRAIPLALGLAVAGFAPAASDPLYPGLYQAELIRVIDGDTFKARVALWPGLTLEINVRIRGIDAPERGELGGLEAAEYLRALLADQTVTLINPRLGKYAGRIVSDVRLGNGRDVGREMVGAGFAREEI